MARPVALLDANVLYPARLSDLLLRLAIDGQFQARWSAHILDECFSNLLSDRPDLAAAHLARTRRLIVEGYEDRVNDIELTRMTGTSSPRLSPLGPMSSSRSTWTTSRRPRCRRA